MAVGKVSYYYELNAQGWTHSFFHTYTGDLKNLFEFALALGTKLMKCVTSDTTLEYVRLSDDAIRGDSEIIDLTTNGAGGGGANWPKQGILNPPTAEPNACIEVRCEGGSLKRRSMFFSGVRAADVDAGKPYNPSVAFKNGIDGVKAALIGDNWTFKARDPSALKYFMFQVTPSLVVGPLQWTVKIAGVVPFLPGTQVIIGGVKPRGGGFSGVYYVLSTDFTAAITTITLGGGTTVQQPGWSYLGGGYIQGILSQFVPFTDLVIRRPGSKKRGRPFGQRLGRTKKKVATA